MKKLSKTLSLSNLSGLSSLLIVWMTWLSAVVIVLLPFHAFVTVWASSLVGHYTMLRLWKEFALAGLVVGGLVALVVWTARLDKLSDWRRILRTVRCQPLVVLIAAYLVLLIGSGLVAAVSGDVTRRAFAYGLLLDGRFLVFFLVTWLISTRSSWLAAHWRPLLLIPASLVVLFGLLQYTVLPVDFLRHFGYGPDTIYATQTIDQKVGYQRIQSTLRGANPLGAYLILIVAAFGVLAVRARPRMKRLRSGLWGLLPARWGYAGLLLASCASLVLTFSRSAWIGALAALGWLIWWSIGSMRVRRLLLMAASVAFVLLMVVGFALRGNDVFQNTILHTDEHSRSSASSNQGHVEATRAGLRDIVQQPLGGGTGTAGPASVYNNHPSRIAENYYLQIGQEIGVAGLGLFVAINLLVGRALWLRRDTALSQILLASLIGISLVNMLSHAWTDDTLCYIWWGLAGVALTLPLSAKHTFKHESKLIKQS